MKTKIYRGNKLICRAYLKPVGEGWETGFILNGAPLFVGNFIHRNEATRFWALLNREVRVLSRKFAIGTFPVAWLKKLIRDQLYSHYYQFVDRVLIRHRREAKRAVLKDVRAFHRIRTREIRRFGVAKRVPLLKAA